MTNQIDAIDAMFQTDPARAIKMIVRLGAGASVDGWRKIESNTSVFSDRETILSGFEYYLGSLQARGSSDDFVKRFLLIQKRSMMTTGFLRLANT